MAKKDKNQEIVFKPDTKVVLLEEEPTYETQAYVTPEPDKGADVTVLKPVGTGGPVPIVAPKHNTVQLQPIVVPLAVVPYMTQDSSVLRTDGGRPQQYAQAQPEYAEAAQMQKVNEKAKAKKSKKAAARVFSLFTFLLSAALLLPFILSYFFDWTAVDISEFNIIGAIAMWIETKTFTFADEIASLIYIVVAAMLAVTVILSLIGIISGKYPRALSCLLLAVAFLGLLAVLIKDVAQNNFVADDRIILIVALAVAALAFALAVIFSLVLNKLEDKEDGASAHAVI